MGTGEKRALYNGTANFGPERDATTRFLEGKRASRGRSSERARPEPSGPIAAVPAERLCADAAPRAVVSAHGTAGGGPATVTLADVEAAAATIAGSVERTPLIAAPAFPGIPAGHLFLKLENLQTTGSSSQARGPSA